MPTTMATRLYFDLATVAELAADAALADDSLATDDEIANRIQAQPALWFYHSAGDVYLGSNEALTFHQLVMGRSLYTVRADSAYTAATGCVQPPDRRYAVALPLLQPEGQPLIDLLLAGLAAGGHIVVVDPFTNAVGVGRRRRRTVRAVAGHQPARDRSIYGAGFLPVRCPRAAISPVARPGLRRSDPTRPMGQRLFRPCMDCR